MGWQQQQQQWHRPHIDCRQSTVNNTANGQRGREPSWCSHDKGVCCEGWEAGCWCYAIAVGNWEGRGGICNNNTRVMSVSWVCMERHMEWHKERHMHALMSMGIWWWNFDSNMVCFVYLGVCIPYTRERSWNSIHVVYMSKYILEWVWCVEI